MTRISGNICDTRCQLVRNEMIRKENTTRMKWFLKNQERLISHLKEPKFTKQAKEIIAESEKRVKIRVDKPIVRRKALPLWRPPRSDAFINIDTMKPVNPNIRDMLYEKGIPTFITTNNYLTERYKEPPEKRFYFPDSVNWIYGWRLDDFPTVPPSNKSLRSVMLTQFYQRKVFNLQQDPGWHRGCQINKARNFNELLTY
ncbi:uncharacterized protein LOC114937378 [Nylanderia fulva]|uniref:uncharacterized protein LOC114937378 n=1 Tax=Nylanderia fulva TaxID=613905 RepID=UPI0010FBB87F|nr:uncharacterized protein LOC114937378 [Nylanderia fulva]